MVSRRRILEVAGAATALALVPGVLRAAAPAAGLTTAMTESDLVYLTPLRMDGKESRCQAEVWFAADGADICVVTATGAWRARAVRNGLTRARVWVGDVGVWTQADGRYRSLPQLETTGSLITDEAERERVLELFGKKYPVSWVLWGGRFRDGLADGSRVMLRYRPQTG
jgi:hypothetical protein